MRNIDWSKKISPEDIAWLRQSGIPYVGPMRTEDAIQDNAKRFKFTAPEEEIQADTVTRSVLDPSGRASEGVVATSETIDRSPAESGNGESEGDEYDQMSVTDLVSVVRDRNQKAETNGTPHVEVVGTGTEGKVRKADLVKGLRLHDQIG